MGGAGPIILAFLALMGFIIGLFFLPSIQVSTNGTNEELALAINAASGGIGPDSPLGPIMHLWPVWAILLLVVLALIIFTKR